MIRYGIDNGINYVDTAYSYMAGNLNSLLAKPFQMDTVIKCWQQKSYLARKNR